MHRILKFSNTDKIVFVSDLHLGHDREFIWGPRGFTSVVEHDEAIRKSWNQYIDEDTIVFNLGDVCFNDPKLEKIKDLSNWVCKDHYVLWGNHNSGSEQLYKATKTELYNVPESVEVYPIEYNKLKFVGNDLCIRIGKIEIHLSHFAKRIWDHCSHGSIALSGHSHGNDSGRNLSNIVGKSLDVGVENALKYSSGQKIFFTLQDILDIVKNRSIESVDHHNSSTNYSR